MAPHRTRSATLSAASQFLMEMPPSPLSSRAPANFHRKFGKARDLQCALPLNNCPLVKENGISHSHKKESPYELPQFPHLPLREFDRAFRRLRRECARATAR